jgi:hypothetical protein
MQTYLAQLKHAQNSLRQPGRVYADRSTDPAVACVCAAMKAMVYQTLLIAL